MRRILKHGVHTWLRRALLLVAVTLGLAMVGDEAVARSQGPPPAETRLGAQSNPGRIGLTLALDSIGAMHRTITSWSDGAVEALSLLGLGLGLIGTGRLLDRKRRVRQRASALQSASDNAAEILKPQESRVRPFEQRAAR